MQIGVVVVVAVASTASALANGPAIACDVASDVLCVWPFDVGVGVQMIASLHVALDLHRLVTGPSLVDDAICLLGFAFELRNVAAGVALGH